MPELDYQNSLLKTRQILQTLINHQEWVQNWKKICEFLYDVQLWLKMVCTVFIDTEFCIADDRIYD